MKAAVLHQLGEVPQFEEFPAPAPADSGQVLIKVKAASIKRLDLGKAAGAHYTSYPDLPVVVGFDGVGVLPGGGRVYAMGISGMMAEEALVRRDSWTPLPAGLSDTLAAALPNALIGSDAALLYRAQIQPGDTVLINGATGATGMVAVQVAKLRGAGRVIVTGRNAAMLERLRDMGADEVISLAQDDAAVIKQVQAAYESAPIAIVLDYLWGQPLSLILEALGKVNMPQATTVVTVGQMAGAAIPLSSDLLRSKKIVLLGSGLGSISMEEFGRYLKRDMPQMLGAAAAGKLHMDVEAVPLKDVAQAWIDAARATKRIVLVTDTDASPVPG